jgi:hypothetical protein
MSRGVVGELDEVGDLAIGGLFFGVVEMIMACVLDCIESKLEGEVSGTFISTCELKVGLSDSIRFVDPYHHSKLK